MRFASLKLLADENISPRIVMYLRANGMDVVDVKEKGWHGKNDEYIINQAVKEKRFVLTHDSDFGTLAINKGVLCCGIIYLRLRSLKISNIIDVLERVLILNREIDDFSIVVVEDTRIRIRNIEY